MFKSKFLLSNMNINIWHDKQTINKFKEAERQAIEAHNKFIKEYKEEEKMKNKIPLRK